MASHLAFAEGGAEYEGSLVGSEAGERLTAPMHGGDLSGLPPALVITAECDALRDIGEQFAARLRNAGAATTVSRYNGVIHGLITPGALVDKADAAQPEACVWLRSAFAGRARGCGAKQYHPSSFGMFSTLPHALQCTASGSWRCRPHCGQG
jgi:hypothetical protein